MVVWYNMTCGVTHSSGSRRSGCRGRWDVWTEPCTHQSVPQSVGSLTGSGPPGPSEEQTHTHTHICA